MAEGKGEHEIIIDRDIINESKRRGDGEQWKLQGRGTVGKRLRGRRG